MAFPLYVNMTTMVKSSAARVSGETRGRKTVSYHVSPFQRARRVRLRSPATNGMPRYVMTLQKTSPIEIATIRPSRPKMGGNMARKNQAYRL